jgi:hypothetical protein
MKTLLFFVAFLQFAFFASGQNLSVYLNDGPRGSVHKIDSENTYRFAFRISGLADDAAVKNFVESCKSNSGVIDVTIKQIDNSGIRSVLLILNDKKDDMFFGTMMKKAGITKIFYNNKEYSPDNLELLKQDRAKNNNQVPASKKTGK